MKTKPVFLLKVTGTIKVMFDNVVGMTFYVSLQTQS